MKIRPALRVLAAGSATLLLAAGGRRARPPGGQQRRHTTIRYFTFSAAPDHVKDLQMIVGRVPVENPTIKGRRSRPRRTTSTSPSCRPRWPAAPLRTRSS